MKLYASLAAAYVGLGVLANYLASKYVVPVPLTGYVAPAGVFCIGGILVLRDWLNQLRGLRASLALVLVAGAASYLVGVAAGWTSLQRIALASLAGFAASQTVEAGVFTLLRRRSLTLAVAVSASAGNVLDSALFLWLAFGSETFLAGNVIGKAEMIAIGVALTAGRRVIFPLHDPDTASRTAMTG